MLIQRFYPASEVELDDLARNHRRNQMPSLLSDGPIDRGLYECSKCTRDSEIKCSPRCQCECHCD